MKFIFRNYLIPGVLAVSLSFTGCMDLDVDNPNEPSAAEAMNSPGDVEAIASDQFLTWWQGTQQYDPAMALGVMGMETNSSWGNFGMLDLGRQPRQAFINTQDYDYNGFVESPWSNLYATINNALEVIERQEDPDFTLGSEAADNRMTMFSKFTMGMAYGSLANHFDRAMLIDEDTDLVDEDGVALLIEPPGSPNYQQTLELGLEKLDEAQEIADNQNVSNIPAGWFIKESGADAISPEQFSRLINFLKARFIASNPRTPQEREEIDWSEIENLARNGVQEDWILRADGSLQWSAAIALYSDHIWKRMNYELIGRTDESGNFQDWLDTPVQQRNRIDLETADDRIIDEGKDQNLAPDDEEYYDEEAYVHNVGLPFHDPGRGTYFLSNYGFVRSPSHSTYHSGFTGPMPFIYQAENDMYLAEALLEQGSLAEAADLINETREDNGGLEPVSEDDGYEALHNAMRYEYEMETLGSSAGLAFYRKRGWGHLNGREYGGLPEGTPLHFPVPAEEMEGVLRMDPYTFGGQDDDEWAAGAQARPGATNVNVQRIIEAMQGSDKEPDSRH